MLKTKNYNYISQLPTKKIIRKNITNNNRLIPALMPPVYAIISVSFPEEKNLLRFLLPRN